MDAVLESTCWVYGDYGLTWERSCNKFSVYHYPSRRWIAHEEIGSLEQAKSFADAHRAALVQTPTVPITELLSREQCLAELAGLGEAGAGLVRERMYAEIGGEAGGA